MEDEPAAGGGGVDRLLQAPEPDPAVGQPGDGVDEMPQGAAEAVEFLNPVTDESSRLPTGHAMAEGSCGAS